MKRFLLTVAFILTILMLVGIASADTLVIPASVKEIGEEAFYGDTSLDHVEVPQGTERIGDRAFAYSSLKTISIPDTVQTIGQDAIPAGVTVYAEPGSDAWNWCMDQDVQLAYAAPSSVSVDQYGTVTVAVTDPRAHTVMLGVYLRQDTTARFPRMKASNGISDLPEAGSNLLAVLPVEVDAESTTLDVNVSSLFRETGVYYIKAKAVSDASEDNAYNLVNGTVIASNTVTYQRPAVSVGNPDNVRWDKNIYGRASWDAVDDAAGYQVTLFSGNNIIASRNINTNHFTFSNGWLDLSNLDHVSDHQYRFSVIGLSDNILTRANSEPVYCYSVLDNPTSTDPVEVLTDPASKYVPHGSTYTVSLNASGIGLSYDWYLHSTDGIVPIVTGTEDPFVTLTANESVSLYAVVHDSMGNEAQSGTATITVVDDTPIDSIITKQPTDETVDSGDRARFEVTVDHSNRYQFWDDYRVEYEWFRITGSTPRLISNKSGAFIDITNEDDGTQVYCEVKLISPTGAVIGTETSRKAKVTVIPKLIRLTKDLQSEIYNARNRNIHIETAYSAGTSVEYVWLYKPATQTQDEYSVWPNANTTYFNASILTENYDGMKLKCVINAANGEQTQCLESNEATIHLGHLPATDVIIYQSDNYGVDRNHMAIGETIHLSASLSPMYTDSTVTWRSSDTGKAKVDKGTVIATGLGSVEIIATSSSGCSSTYEITIDSFQIRLLPNGGMFSDGRGEAETRIVQAGDTINLPVLSKENDTFLGWWCEGTTYTGSYIPTGSVSLSAVWESTTETETEELDIQQDLPAEQYAQYGYDALFEVVTNGARVTSYQWFCRTSDTGAWTPVNNGVTFNSYRTSLSVESTAEKNGWQFKVELNGLSVSKTSNICTLGTGAEPTKPAQPEPVAKFVTQPNNLLVREGDSAAFTAAVNTAARYQWQEKINGEWTDVSGQTSQNMILENVTTDMGGKQYRCSVTAGTETLTSSEATLSVIRISISKTAGEEHPVAGEAITLRCDYEIFGETSQNETVSWTTGNSQIGDLSGDQGSSVVLTVGSVGSTDIRAAVRGIEASWKLEIDHVMVTAYAGDGVFSGTNTEKSARITAGSYTPEQLTADFGMPGLNGYTFMGWTDEQDGNALTSIVIGEGTVLYAVWKKDPVYATAIHIQRNETEPDLGMLVPGNEIHFTAVTVPEETDDSFTWTSSNPEIAAVDQEGTVTVLTTGTATITVQANNVSNTVNLNINHFKITLNANGGTFVDNQETHEEKIETIGAGIAIYVVPDTAPVRENYHFDGWERDGNAVSGEIVVRANTTLSAKWSGNAPRIVQDLDLNYYPDTGNGFTVVADGIDLYYKWQTRMPGESSWTDVGTNSNTYAPELNENHNGMQIRCVIEDCEYNPATVAYSRIATFNWIIHPNSIQIEEENVPDDLIVGDQIRLRAVAEPENCTDPATWASADENVATVSNGTVTITGQGETTITVSVYNKSASYTVLVNHVSVTLNANGGQFDEKSEKTVRIETGSYSTMPVFDTPTRDGYEFKGWNTQQSGTALTSINILNTLTLYAVWERLPVYATALSILRTEETPDISKLIPGDVLHYIVATEPVETDDEISWISSNPDVASVNNGTVTINKTGSATITAQTENVSDTAIIIVNHLKVMLDANGGKFGNEESTQETIIQADSSTGMATFTLPATNPTRDQYVFGGWTENNTVVSGEISITDNTTLSAKWDGINPTITQDLLQDYYVGNGTGRTSGFEISASGHNLHYQWQIKMPNTIAWSNVTENDLNCYTPQLDSSHDGMQVRCVVEDHWYLPATTTVSVEATYHWNLFTVTYDAGEGIFSDNESVFTEEVIQGEEYSLIELIPTRDGYTFDGWLLNSNAIEGIMEVNSNITLTASWISNSPRYTVTYNANGGTFSGSEIITNNVEGGLYTISDAIPANEGYDFSCWVQYKENPMYSWYPDEIIIYHPGELIELKEDLMLTARWEMHYDEQPASVSISIEGDTEKTITISPWQTEIRYTIYSVVTPDMGISLTYLWEESNDRGTWDVASSSEYSDMWLEHEEPGGAPSIRYYRLTVNGVRSNIVTVRIEEESSSMGLYAVTLKANGGRFKCGEPEITETRQDHYWYSSNEEPTKAGYTFIGWMSDGELIGSNGISLSGDTTLTAAWEANLPEYTITYDANGGSFADGKETITEKSTSTRYTINSTKPVRDGYRFTGWMLNGQTVSGTIQPEGSFTLEAQWIQLVTLTYDANGGLFYGNKTQITNTYDINRQVSLYASPTYENMILDGWKDALGNRIEGSITLTEDTTVYAIWISIPDQYTVTLDAGSGVFANGDNQMQVLVDRDTNYIPDQVPTRAGYQFDGWTRYSSIIGYVLVNENITLTARWIEAYSVVPTDVTVSGSYSEYTFHADEMGMIWEDGFTNTYTCAIGGVAPDDIPNLYFEWQESSDLESWYTAESGYGKTSYSSFYGQGTNGITYVRARVNGVYSEPFILICYVNNDYNGYEEWHRVVYDANGGVFAGGTTVRASCTTYQYGYSLETYSPPARSGYIFNGWMYNDVIVETVDPYENIVVYAAWTEAL